VFVKHCHSVTHKYDMHEARGIPLAELTARQLC